MSESLRFNQKHYARTLNRGAKLGFFESSDSEEKEEKEEKEEGKQGEAVEPIQQTGQAPCRNWMERIFTFAYYKKLRDAASHSAPASLAFFAERDIICVQCKSRTPAVGLTISTLTQNLALLPPRGVVRTTGSFRSFGNGLRPIRR